ncbi:MAG: TolC family protein [Tannerella sp.]|nr:TolC family protein [Tannerella sp.]
MYRILLTATLLFTFPATTPCQEKSLTMEACMLYGIENSPAVKKQQYINDTYKAEYISSITSFLPSISTGLSATYNYGRSLDEDNIYQDKSSFSNRYNGEVSLPVFTGGILVNEWRKAKINRKLGVNDIQKEKDELAIKIMAAYVDAVYYKGTVTFAEEKLHESNRLLYKTNRMEELGLKGRADIAQMEAQVAADDYTFTRYANLYNMALATLKELMNYPSDQVLAIDTSITAQSYLLENESLEDIYHAAKETNPAALQADYQLQAYKMQHLIEKGRLLPAVSFIAGINTEYFEDLKFDYTGEKPLASFKSQFKDKMGEYVAISINIPLFNGLNRITNVRRAGNNVRMAIENRTQIHRQLETSIEKALLERGGYAKETVQMEKKVASEEYAYQVTLRKYEEGLTSPLDLQTSSNILIQSRADLLQKKLMYFIKCKEVDYYKGKPLIN